MSLIVDVDNIKKNIQIIKRITQKEVMVVQKSNAYDLNSKKIIPILKEENIKWIVYNKYQEYLDDQNLLDDVNVLVMESPTIHTCGYSVVHTINNFHDACVLLKCQNKTRVHLQVDTGMNRLGIRSVDEAKKIIDILKTNQNISIEGIYTHFSSAEDEQIYYSKQIEAFKQYLTLYPFKYVHSAASSSLTKNIVGNMVRVGMSIYGYASSSLKLFPSLSLRVSPLNSFLVEKGNKIGYEQEYDVKRRGYISVLPLGYDDIIGITEITKGDKRYRIVGKICMNHLFIFSSTKINNLTRLNVLSKNDIITYRKYNWYLIITSMKKIPKNYLRRTNYDISKVFNRTDKTYQKYQFRKRSN